MNNSLKLVTILYTLTCISVSLDIVILRQIFGFFCLSFIPGYLFLKILKRDEVDHVETVVFSIGLSIAFLMFLGLLVNALSPAFNLSKPLSTFPLIIAISGLTLILLLLGFKQIDKEVKPVSFGKANTINVLQICLLLVLPVFGIVGALYHNTEFLILMILGVGIMCAASIFSDRLIPRDFLPLAIFLTSIALLLHTALISKHLMGYDAFNEFYVFKLTEIQGSWHAPGIVISYSLIDTINSILSVTILPAVYTVILKIDGAIFFKLFYPLVFALIPLVLYKMYEQQTGSRVAFISVFFFISMSITFYGIEPLSLNRQIIGQLFFILSIFLIIEKKMVTRKKRVLLIIFASALVLSHYSLAFIFLSYILFLFIFPRIARARAIFPYLKEHHHITQILSKSLILLLIALTFSWYIYVSNSPLNQLLYSVNRIIKFFVSDFFRAETRLPPALSSLSPTAPSSLIGIIHKALIYLEHFFIGIGIIVLIIKPKEFNLYPEFRLTAIISFLILALCLVVPNFALTLNTTRFYSIVIPFLTPFFIFGCTFLLRFIGKFFVLRLPKLNKVFVKNLGVYVASCVLIITFLFQVGLINHVTGDYPYSYPLDLDRRENSNDLSIKVETHSLYFLDQEVISAKWLMVNMNSTSKVYADSNSRQTFLRSYALLPDDRMLAITNETKLDSQTYIYLKYLNVRIGVISERIGGTYKLLNTSDLSPIMANCSKIYSNGDSDIYFTP